MCLKSRRIIFYKESDVPVQTDYSPWGEIQALETLYPGIHLITTPGHGGIMAEWPAYLELSVAARKCGFRENGCLWFEEDCCEQVVLRELLDRGMWTLPDRSATRQSLKKESTESSSSITRTIGQREKRAAPFRKPAKCERKTICLSERGNKPIKPYKTMTLRLNAAEYAHLCRQAEVTGLKKEPLVRQLIMGVNLRPRPPDAYADLLRALSAIGNNINQLAHQANARGAATGDEITEALHLVRQATRLVRERL